VLVAGLVVGAVGLRVADARPIDGEPPGSVDGPPEVAIEEGVEALERTPHTRRIVDYNRNRSGSEEWSVFSVGRTVHDPQSGRVRILALAPDTATGPSAGGRYYGPSEAVGTAEPEIENVSEYLESEGSGDVDWEALSRRLEWIGSAPTSFRGRWTSNSVNHDDPTEYGADWEVLRETDDAVTFVTDHRRTAVELMAAETKFPARTEVRLDAETGRVERLAVRSAYSVGDPDDGNVRVVERRHVVEYRYGEDVRVERPEGVDRGLPTLFVDALFY
jgi:hypothetical protein